MADDPVDGEADSSVDRPIPKSNPVGPLSIPVLNANPTDSFPAQPMVVDASSRDSDNKAKPPSAIAPGRPYLPSPILAPTPPPIKAPGSAVTKALAVAESSSESDSDSESDGSAVMTSSNVLPVVIATPRPAPKAATRPHASWPTTQVTTNGSPSPSDSSDEDDQPTTTPRPAFMPSIVHHFTSLISRFSSSPSASTATDIGIGHPEAKHAADPGPSKTPNRKVTAARSIVKPPMMYSSPHTGLSGPVGSSSDEDSSDNSDGSPKRWCAPTATSQSVKATEVKPCANIAGKGKGGELAGATADGSATKDSPAVPSVATPSPLQTSEIPVTLPPPSQPSTHTSDVPSSASGHGTLQKVEATEARPVNFSAYDPSRPSAVLPISNIETIEDASHHETKLAVPATDIAPTPALLPMAAGLAPAPRNTAVDDAEYSSYSDDSDSDSDSDNQERDVTVAPTPPEPLPIPETRVGSPTAEPELTMKPSDRDSESDGPVPVKLAAAVALPASQLATRSLSGISTDSSDEEDEDSQLTKTPGTTHARSPYSFKYTSLQSIPSMSKLTATENGSHRDSDGSDQGSRRATQSNVPGNPKPQPPTRRTPIVKPPVMTPGLQPAAQSCSNTSSDDDTSSSDDDDNNGSRLFNRRVAPAIAYRNRPGLVPTPTPAARVALRDSSPSSINPTASISDDDQDSDSEASDILSTKVQTQASELTSLTPTHALEPGLANEESRSTLRPVVSTFDVDDKTSTLQPPILETRTPSNDASHAETDTTNHIPRNMTPEIPSTIPGAVADVSSASDSASSTGSNTDSDDTDNERQNSQAKAATATTAPPTPPPNTDSASAGPPAGRDVTETTASPRPTEALKPGSGAQLGSGEHTPDYPGDRTETTTITTPSSGPLAPVDPPANPEITKATVEPQIGKATEPISDYSSDPDSDSDGGDTGSQRGQVDSSTMPGPTPMTAGVVTSLSACEASASESTDEGDMNARTEAPPNPPQNPESTRLPAAATVSDSSSDSSSNSEGEQPTPTVAAAPLPLLQTPAPKPAQTVTPRLAKRPASDSDSNDSDSDVNHPPSKRLKSHEPSRVQARLNSRNPVIKRPIRMSKRPAPDTSSDESDSDGDDGPGKSGPTALPNPATGAVPHHGPTGAPRAAPKSHFLSLSAISRAGTFAGLRDNAFLVSGAAKVLVDPKFGSTTADTDRSDVTAAAAAGNHHPAMRRSVSGGGRTGPANRLARFSMGPVPNRAHQKGDDDESDSEPSSESNSDSDSSGDDDDGKKAGSSGTSSRPPLSTGLNFIPRPKSAQIPGMSGGKAAPVIKMARGPVAKSVKDKSRRRTMF
ncbi:hypothetical protein IWQ60_003906 [Tieghemiomyces parasiticus]|uniref:Uncharacterized protein n=1 Tax=Tieghemiomyces parasiticus TaxID=78921 RepID=A0A9W8AH43_9FUNG|nr:hypothetical protein IWQ60_003906 [Tieghemiomyces parasiticus]